MRLPDSLLRIGYTNLYYKGLSSIHIFCEEGLRKTIAEEFEEAFYALYRKKFISIMRENCKFLDPPKPEYPDGISPNDLGHVEYYYQEQKDAAMPLKSVEVTDYGVRIRTGELDIRNRWDHEKHTLGYADESLKQLLEDISSRYPSCSIKGYIGYYWNDDFDDGHVQWDISIPSKEKKYEGEDTILTAYTAKLLCERIRDDLFSFGLHFEMEKDERENLPNTLAEYRPYMDDGCWEQMIESIYDDEWSVD